MKGTGSILICSLYIFSKVSSFQQLPLRAAISTTAGVMAASSDIPTSEEGWRTVLDPNQFAVLRKKATE